MLTITEENSHDCPYNHVKIKIFVVNTLSVSIDAVDEHAVNVFEGILWYCIISSC